MSIPEQILYLAHGLGVDEVLVAPDAGIIIVLPLQVNVKVRQVVALRHRKLLPHLVALLFSTLKKKKEQSQKVGNILEKTSDLT